MRDQKTTTEGKGKRRRKYKETKREHTKLNKKESFSLHEGGPKEGAIWIRPNKASHPRVLRDFPEQGEHKN